MRISEILSKEKLKQLYEDITRRGFLKGLGLAGGIGAGGYTAYNQLNKPEEPPKKLPVVPSKRKPEPPKPEPPKPEPPKPKPVFIPLEHKEDLIELSKKSGITKPQDLGNFFGQIYTETSKWRLAEENLNYSTPSVLYRTFKSKFKNVNDTKPYLNNPEKLANYVYANKNGNGDVNSGDGWRYRGRGFLHLTGKELYQKAGRAVHPDNPNIYVNNPDILSTDPNEAALASIWYFKSRVGLGRSSNQATRKVNPAGLKSGERRDASREYTKTFKKDK